jgi:hypothetical protein
MPGHLQLVNDGTRASGTRLDVEALAPAIGRPGDRCEPVHLDRTEALQELASTAPKAGLPLELAVSLLMQRQLVLDDLEAAEIRGGGVPPDHTARQASTSVPLCGAAAGYVRDLQRRCPLEAADLLEGVLVPLPFRIVDRLRATDRHRGLSSRWLDQARRWEIASAVQGRTMAEWSMLALVRSTASDA